MVAAEENNEFQTLERLNESNLTVVLNDFIISIKILKMSLKFLLSEKNKPQIHYIWYVYSYHRGTTCAN